MITKCRKIQKVDITAICFDGSTTSFNECREVLGEALKKDYEPGEDIKLKYYGLTILPGHWFVKDPTITACWVVLDEEKFRSDYEEIH